MRGIWLTMAVLAAGCGGGKAEVKASADFEQAGLDDEPPPQWDDSSETASDADRPPAHPAREPQPGLARPSGAPTATFPGFEVFEDGTSRVFVEIAGGRVPVEEIVSNGVYRYRFSGVRVPGAVNQMPLPTTHFESPISEVRLAQVGDDAELIIHLRYLVPPNPRVRRSDDGTVLSVDFPLHPPAGEPQADGVSAPAPRTITPEESVPERRSAPRPKAPVPAAEAAPPPPAPPPPAPPPPREKEGGEPSNQLDTRR